MLPKITVEVWAKGGVDKYGDPLPATLVASIPGCLFAPKRSVVTIEAMTVVDTTAAVYLPKDASYQPKSGDTIKIDGVSWTVEGDPDIWPLGIEVPVRKTT